MLGDAQLSLRMMSNGCRLISSLVSFVACLLCKKAGFCLGDLVILASHHDDQKNES